MNLKELKQKKTNLIAELEDMVSVVETETRALTDEELDAFKAKKSEIERIDKTISMVQEQRMAQMDAPEQKVEQEKRSKEEMEKRAMDSFFRGDVLDAETRAMLGSNSNNSATYPLTIAEGILKKLEEMCPVLEKARRFSSKGVLRLLNETSYGDGALTAENAEFHDADAELGHIELTAYKVSAQTKATFELLKNSSVDLDKYLTDVIVRRLAKQLNKLFLVGTGSSQPQGLVNGKQTVELASAVITYDDIVKIITAMHPDFLSDAVFIMNRKTFTAVSLLEDGNGHKYVQNGIVNGKFTYTLAGIPIIIDNHMDDLQSSKKPIILANIAEAYSINLLQDITVKRLSEIEFLNGVEVFAGYVMADGKITNEDAVKVMTVA